MYMHISILENLWKGNIYCEIWDIKPNNLGYEHSCDPQYQVSELLERSGEK